MVCNRTNSDSNESNDSNEIAVKKQLIISLASQIKELEEQIVERCKFIEEKNKELDAIHTKIKSKKKDIGDREIGFKQNVQIINEKKKMIDERKKAIMVNHNEFGVLNGEAVGKKQELCKIQERLNVLSQQIKIRGKLVEGMTVDDLELKHLKDEAKILTNKSKDLVKKAESLLDKMTKLQMRAQNLGDEIEQINEEIKSLLESNIQINDESKSAHEQVGKLCEDCKLRTKDCGVIYEQLERMCDERKKLSQELIRLNQEVII